MRHMQKKFKTTQYMSERLRKLKNINYVVDRLHIAGHKQAWCKEECHPDCFKPNLDNINTVIVEQVNAWLGKYKFMTKHMNLYRFNFFIYILLNEYNTMKLVGKSNINHRFKLVKSSSKKRFIEEIDSDMEQ